MSGVKNKRNEFIKEEGAPHNHRRQLGAMSAKNGRLSIRARTVAGVSVPGAMLDMPPLSIGVSVPPAVITHAW